MEGFTLKKFAILISTIFLMLITSCNTTDTSTEYQTENTTSVTTTTTTITTTSTTEVTEFQYHSMLDNYNQDTLPEALKNLTWTEDIVFTDLNKLEEYITEQVNMYVEKIPAIIPNGSQSVDNDFFSKSNFNNINMIGSQTLEYQLQANGKDAKFIVYNVRYSAGENILQAIKKGDTSTLSSEELQAYNIANDFISNTLDKSKSPIEQERQIFDFICDKITYYNQDNPSEDYPRFRSCIGGLCDGSANCMGYTDTFYLLSNMVGLDVSCASDHDMLHEWNLITIDNKKYLVDTTFSDDSYLTNDGINGCTYKFFNAGMDLVSNYYTFKEDNPTNEIVSNCDENYFYNVFTENTVTPENVISEINKRLSSNEPNFELFSYGTMPFNTIDEFEKVLLENLSTDVLSKGFSYDWDNYGNLNYFVFFFK